MAMADAPDLKFAIGLEPAAAVEYLRSKNVQVSDRWHEVWQEAHAKAFTVAGVARDDVLTDVQKSLTQALKSGETFAQWRDGLNKTLENRGWIGRAGVDKSGEFHGGKIAPHRLDTIFRTNMQSAFAAGRYQAALANVGTHSYWMYSAVMDRRTRPAHAALNGRTFRYDDPFWRSFYPPNGYRCRCKAISLTPDQVGNDKDQFPESKSAGQLDTIKVPMYQGTSVRVPVARFEYSPGKYVTPDPGFSTSPGTLFDRGWQKPFVPPALDGAPPPGRVAGKAAAVVAATSLPAPAALARQLPPGLTPEQYASAFLNEFGATAEKGASFTDVTGTMLQISRDLLAGRDGHLKSDKGGRGVHLLMLADTIKAPDEIWLKIEPSRETGRMLLKRRYLRRFLLPGSDQHGIAAFEWSAEGWRGSTVFVPHGKGALRYYESQRDGARIYVRPHDVPPLEK